MEVEVPIFRSSAATWRKGTKMQPSWKLPSISISKIIMMAPQLRGTSRKIKRIRRRRRKNLRCLRQKLPVWMSGLNQQWVFLIQYSRVITALHQSIATLLKWIRKLWRASKQSQLKMRTSIFSKPASSGAIQQPTTSHSLKNLQRPMPTLLPLISGHNLNQKALNSSKQYPSILILSIKLFK